MVYTHVHIHFFLHIYITKTHFPYILHHPICIMYYTQINHKVHNSKLKIFLIHILKLNIEISLFFIFYFFFFPIE